MVEAGSHRILVTGASGFVGGWLLPALAETLPGGSEILATCRDEIATGRLPRVRTVRLDITDRDAVRRVAGEWKPTGIVHLAALANVPEASRNARAAWDVNLGGTLNLAEAVRESGIAARMVFAGTAEVYGGTFATQSGALDETAILEPANTYAATKAAADLALGQLARDGLEAVRFRPFNHTGPGQGEGFVLPAFAAQIARIEAGRQEPVLRVGNLDAKRDFLDVRDVVAGYVLALMAPAVQPGRIFNLASGRSVRIGDMLETLLGAARLPIKVEVDPARMRPSDIPETLGRAERARAELGWIPRIVIETTLADVLADWRSRIVAV